MGADRITRVVHSIPSNQLLNLKLNYLWIDDKTLRILSFRQMKG